MDFDYFGDRPQDVPLEHRRRVNMQVHERYRIRDFNDPLGMSLPEFTKLYRMPQDAAVALTNILAPYVPQRRSPNHTPLIRKVLVTLSLLGMGSYQRLLGRSIDCAVSQTSVSRAVHEVVAALNHPHILTRFIRFPMTREERAPIIRRNEQLGIPRVLGIIDGTLLKLTGLPRNNERQAFFTRKGWTGLNVQLICDAELNILNVDSTFPGSVTDHMIWNASAARNVVERAYWEDRCWLLGDSGYFTAPWLHIPLPHAEIGTPEYDYTQLHCSCRNCIERCIGVLKGRWRILTTDRAINYKDAAFAGSICNACCVLHNFCLDRRLPHFPPVFERFEDELPLVNDLPQNIQELGMAEMNHLINYAHQRRLHRNNVVNAY